MPEYGENELGENVFGGGAGADIPEDADDSAMPWAGSDREYTYDEVRTPFFSQELPVLLLAQPDRRALDGCHLLQLLSRVFRILRSQNPELAGERRRYTIAPPQMLRDGNKKTIFANLADICKRMHRSDEHVIAFLYAELGTSGSVDGSHRLIIKGRYTQKHMENVLRRYIGPFLLPWRFEWRCARVDRPIALSVCPQSSMSRARPASRQTRSCRRRTASSS